MSHLILSRHGVSNKLVSLLQVVKRKNARPKAVIASTKARLKASIVFFFPSLIVNLILSGHQLAISGVHQIHRQGGIILEFLRHFSSACEWDLPWLLTRAIAYGSAGSQSTAKKRIC